MPCTFKASPDGADSGRASAGSRRDFFHLRRRQPQRYTYRVLQTIQMKLIILCVKAERAVLGSANTALEFKYEI